MNDTEKPLELQNGDDVTPISALVPVVDPLPVTVPSECSSSCIVSAPVIACVDAHELLPVPEVLVDVTTFWPLNGPVKVLLPDEPDNSFVAINAPAIPAPAPPAIPAIARCDKPPPLAVPLPPAAAAEACAAVSTLVCAIVSAAVCP